jgi:hypothetical protein
MRKPVSLRSILAFAMLFFVLAPRAAVAQDAAPPIPPQLAFLPTLGVVRKNITCEKWGEFKFSPGDTVRRGQHWTLLVNLKAAADKQVIWNAMKPTFLRNGWTVVKEFGPGSTVVTVSRNYDGAEAWAAVDINFDVATINMVLVGQVPMTLTLAAPAATPEKMATDKGDFPYLAPLTGSRFHGGSQDPSPFWVLPKGASQKEMVAPTSLVRSYSLPNLSNLMFMTVYRDALTHAGWEIWAYPGFVDRLVFGSGESRLTTFELHG